MKKIIAASLLLTACGGTTTELVLQDSQLTPETTVTVSETTTTTVAPTTTLEPVPETRPTLAPYEEPPMNGYQPDVYLDMVQDDIPLWYYSYSDENLLSLSIAICDSLDAGAQIDRLLVEVMLMVADVDPALNDSLGLWMRYVVRYICPEHYGQIEALAN